MKIFEIIIPIKLYILIYFFGKKAAKNFYPKYYTTIFNNLPSQKRSKKVP